MPLETDGFDGLMTDIAGMARRMDADGEGAGTAKRILEAAAVPIHHWRPPRGLEPRGLLSLICGIWPCRTGSRARASLHPSRL